MISFSIIYTILVKDLSFKETDMVLWLYNSGKFIMINASLWGLFINLLLPPAPRYVKVLILTPDKNMEEDHVWKDK